MIDIASIIEQLERQRASIETAIDALQSAAGQAIKKGPGRPKGSKKTASNDGRQRQIEAMRRYWAEKRAGSKKTAAKKKSGGLTEAGRKALAENMRKRWAAKRAK